MNTVDCTSSSVGDQHFKPKLWNAWTVQNSLDNVDAGMPLAQDIPALLSDSTTEHYNSTCKHYTSLWLAFLPSLQRGRALKPTFIAFNRTSMHCHAYTRDKTRSFQSRNASLLRALEMAPHYRGSTVDLCIAQLARACSLLCVNLHVVSIEPLQFPFADSLAITLRYLHILLELMYAGIVMCSTMLPLTPARGSFISNRVKIYSSASINDLAV